MSPPPPEATILSLPDDVLSKIFSHLSASQTHTLQSSLSALSLARANTRLRSIFASHLTRITPITENLDAPAFAEEHVEALVRLAAGNLRELTVPDGDHAYVGELAELCPSLEVVSYFEIHHDVESERSLPAGGGDGDDASDNGHVVELFNLANHDDPDNDAANDADPDGDDVNGEHANEEDGNGDAVNNEGPDDENANNDGANGDEANHIDGNGQVADHDDANNDDGNGDDVNGVHGNGDGANIVDANHDDANDDANDDGNGGDINSDGANNVVENTDDANADDADNADANSVDGNDGDANDVDGNEDAGGDDNGGDDGNGEDANSDGSTSDDGNDSDSEHGVHLSEVSISRNRSTGCEIMLVLPRLQLRVLSITRPSNAFFENMTSHSLEKLQLHRVRKHQLALIVPLLSQSLKSLTVTVHDFEPFISNSKRVSNFIDALMPIVSQLVSLTLHIPFTRGLETFIETMSHYTHYVDFPERAASLIASTRRNTCPSDCTKLDLKGDSSFRVLSAANQKASITLTRARVTVRDDGEGTRITGLPLDEEFLHRDVSHLEKAYILTQCRRLDHVCNPEWGRRLAGRRLRVIRTCDARVLNTLRFSTEKLELLCRGFRDVNDWKCLSGVRELYLLGIPGEFSKKPRHRTIDVVEALPRMVDAFQGELIWVGIYCTVSCRDCPFLDDLVESAKAAKEALDRFEMRGGDAGTLQSYIERVLRNSEKAMEEVPETP